MKNSLKSAALIAFLLVPSMSKVAFGGEIPDCRDTPEVKYGKDSWNVTVNSDDSSDKSDILGALKIIGTGGFNANHVLTFGDESIFVNLVFDRSYYQGEEANKVLLDSLKKLVSLKGVIVECDALATPMPSITVRN